MPKTEPVTTTDSTSLNQKFKKIGEQIYKVAVDFTTLNVTTLTGDFSHFIKTGSGNSRKNKVDFSNFLKEIGDAGKTDAKISLVAYTNIDFDQDTVNFVKENMSAQEQNLFNIHKASIDSAHQARQSFLNFLKEIL